MKWILNFTFWTEVKLSVLRWAEKPRQQFGLKLNFESNSCFEPFKR